MFLDYLLKRDFIVAETECIIFLKILSTQEIETSNDFLFSFGNDAVLSVIKLS